MIRPFALERFFAAHEFTAPHLMCASDCESMSIGDLLELCGTSPDELLALRLGYTESQGDPRLREVIAARHADIAPDDVLVTNAPEEAVFLVMHAALCEGDRVVVLDPCYQSLGEVARFRGASVVPWRLIETDAGWRPDIDELDRLLRDDTALLVINFPHNPTGCHVSAAEFAAILALARERGVRVFSDEMYRGLEHDPAQRLATAPELDDRAASLCGTSKSFGLPGLRIGWLITRDRQLMDDLARWKDYTTICSSAPGELLARIALEHENALTERSQAIVRENEAHMAAFLGRHPDMFAWRPPAAGPVAFPRLHAGGAAALCARLREEAGVLLVAGNLFGAGDDHVRLGLGRRSFNGGLRALEEWLASQQRPRSQPADQ